MQTIIQCPVCKKALVKHNKHYSCILDNSVDGKHGPLSHQYDVAKEGYVNLNLNSKVTAGDSKEMMQSRRDFLNLNHYYLIIDSIIQVINTYISTSFIADTHSADISVINSVASNSETNNEATHTEPLSILDIGCGEGYYLDILSKHINKTIAMDFYGLDISKIGVKMAAKRTKEVSWLVANSARLPFLDRSLDVALSIFSIYTAQEVCRCMKDNGIMMIVRAGENHLLELREIIYPEIIEKNKSAIYDEALFECISEHNISDKMHIHGQQSILQLLEMTPHYWKIKQEYKERLQQREELLVSIDFKVIVLKKKES